MHLALVVLLGFTLFSCGSPAPTEILQPGTTASTTPTLRDLVASEESQQSITFATDADSLSVYQSLADEFNAAHPAIRVVVLDIHQVKGNWYQFAPTPTMLNELASKVDTFLLPESSLPVGLGSGALLDLTPLAESDPGFAADDFFSGILERFRREGGLWGLPAGVGELLIFYNKGSFDQAGVEYPAPGWTWDEFLDDAVRLTAGEGRSKQYGFFDAFGGQGVISFIQQHGGDLLDRKALYPTPTLDDPLVAEAVKWYVDLTLAHGVSPRRSELGGMIPPDLILDHRAATWTDILPNWQALSKRLGNVGIAPFPEDRTAANPVNLSGYFVSAGTAYPQACWQWLSFLTQQHIVPESAEQLPARRSVFETSEYFAEMNEQDRAAILYALEHPAPPMIAHEPIVMKALLESLGAVLAGEATVEQALAQAQAKAEVEIAGALAEATAAPTPPSVRPVPSPTPEEAPIGLTFFVGDDLDAAPYQTWAEQFNQHHPDASVAVERGTPLNFGETAGSADCFLWPTFARPDDWQQHTVPLQPFVEGTRDFPFDDFYPQGLVDFHDGGGLWGLPLFVVPELIYFNADLFDAAGVPYPVPGWRWDDFVTAAEALTGGEGKTKQYGFASSITAAPEAMAFILQHGASLVDNLDDPMIPTFNTQAAVEALDRYADLVNLYRVMPSLWASSDPYAAQSERMTLIRSGRVAMWTDSPWAGNLGYDFAVGAAPLPGDRQDATDFDSWGAYISAYSPYSDQCWDWLAYLSDHLVTGPGVPARRSLAEGLDLTREGDIDKVASLASMNHENIRLNLWRDRTGWMGWVYPWFEQAVQDTLAGQESASQALDKTQSRAEAFLRCLESPGEILSEAEALACAREVDPTYSESIGHVQKQVPGFPGENPCKSGK